MWGNLLINQMVGRKSAKTADTPGVTRSKMWLKVDNSLELLIRRDFMA